MEGNDGIPGFFIPVAFFVGSLGDDLQFSPCRFGIVAKSFHEITTLFAGGIGNGIDQVRGLDFVNFCQRTCQAQFRFVVIRVRKPLIKLVGKLVL